MADDYTVSGFKFAAVSAGVKKKGRLDLGLIAGEEPYPAAGLFTRNLVKSPSVVLCGKRLRGGKAQAVLVNSGNANACVGPRGMADALKITESAGERLGIKPALVLMNSTGVIGEPLPAGRIISALPRLVRELKPEGFPGFARAIMTTDTRPKLARRVISHGKNRAVIAGAAKGAGMIMPNLATMLVYILTDAAIGPRELKRALAAAAEDSFNALTVDGDTSTNDSVIIMASGRSGFQAGRGGPAAKKFQAALSDLCQELAVAVAADGEGATKWFSVLVEGAHSRSDADRVARRIANSPLVKTAFHAGDPNWGRLMMAAGSAGVKLDPDRLSVVLEDAKGRKVPVVERGARATGFSEARAERILKESGFTVRVNLHAGKAFRTIYTCDLSAEYVKINAEYRT